MKDLKYATLVLAALFSLAPAIIPLALPAVANADTLLFKSLIVCDPGGEPPVGDANPDASKACTFADFITLANNVITDIFFISIPLATIGFGVAGFLYLTAGGNEGQANKAKGIFWGIAKGFAWILVAYLLVYAIVTPLLNSAYNLIPLATR